MLRTVYTALIANGAFKPFLAGLLITVLITVVSLLIATVAGAVLCALARSRFTVCRIVSRTCVMVLGGTPALLVLLLFYYVFFAPFGIEALPTAFVAFGLKMSANIAGIFRTALDGVDRGQVQAARTLGFSATGAFFNVTLPQAVRLCGRLYQNMVIDLLQWTSVAGYITISELTRVVNNMQARTGKPFFAMAVGVFLYLLLAALVKLLFSLNNKKHKSPRGQAGALKA
jgi:polar amino acid transport system permease protein/polar amino acid transport system substrate-binding protein